jgi:hypothetical protein
MQIGVMNIKTGEFLLSGRLLSDNLLGLIPERCFFSDQLA